MSHPAAPDGSGTPPGRSGIEVAVPEPSTTDPVLLGGAGGAIRPSGWCDSPQWVVRFAPVGGAIRPITNNKAHDEAAKNAVLA
jgi:hypothetical protein